MSVYRAANGLAAQGRLCIYELMAEDSAVNYWEVSLSRSVPGAALMRP